jgi:inner membrane protein
MDPLSQGLVGAAAAQAVAGGDRLRWAALLGGVSGMAPDLDVLIRSSEDPLLFLEYHRQFTHALLFVPFGALLCALPLSRFTRGKLRFRSTYALCFVGYATHGLLDGCTSYGTQLLWPFSDARVAWNNVAVVDPLFTLLLVIFVALALHRKSKRLAQIGCAVAIAYLLVGVVQRERAEGFGANVAASRSHTPQRVVAKPAFGSLVLWKTIYEDDDRFHVDAVRLGWQARSFAGDSLPKFSRERDLPWLDHASQQAADIERFRWFSSGFVAMDPERADRLIDVRYSLVPNRIEALWGIRLDRTAGARQHAEFFTSRSPTPEQRQAAIRMFVD